MVLLHGFRASKDNYFCPCTSCPCKISRIDPPRPVLNPKRVVLVKGRPFSLLGSLQERTDWKIDSQLNRHLSLGLELSFGNFDVVFFPEKLNFFDASQEKFEFWNYHFISKFFILSIFESKKRCANLRGELPVPRNWEDVDALGQIMLQYNETKIWSAVVDGTPGLQNGDQKFWNYNTKEYLGK